MKNCARLLLYALPAILSIHSYGQVIKPASQTNNIPSAKPIPQSFLITGKITNFKDSLWRFFYPGLFKNQVIEMPVAADGSFSKSIKINNPNDVGLYLGDGIKILAVPGDTLILSWDNENLNNTFKVKANKWSRQKEIDLMISLSIQYRHPMLDMVKENDSKTPDSVKFTRVNNMLTEQIKTIIKYPHTENWEKILYDQYFDDKSFLKALRLKGDYKLFLSKAIADSLEKHYVIRFSSIDNTLNEMLFLKSSEYRNAIVEKVHTTLSPYTSVSYEGAARANTEPNYTLKDCYAGMAFLYWSPLIRDWYLVQSIINGYGHYKFEFVEQAYAKFLPEITNTAFKDELITYRNTLMQTLKPGVPAPAFTLKDINGKLVSLSDFKGKVVYIDFWGVGCGPCIYDTKTYAADLHEKYKDKTIVYLNICVDATNTEWKSKVKELSMNGVNVIAPGWSNNPVCKAYNVTGIPHYILIDTKGNIANNNAPRMGDLLNNGNELDKLLVIK